MLAICLILPRAAAAEPDAAWSRDLGEDDLLTRIPVGIDAERSLGYAS